MKKLLVYVGVFASLMAFTACNEDFNEGIAEPQTWEEEAAAAGFTFSASAASPINLNNVTASSVSLCSFSTPVAEGAELKYQITLTNADGSKKVVFDMNSKGEISTADLQATVTDFYGKRPVENTLLAVANAAAIREDGQALRAFSDKMEIKVTPKAPFIDTAYYLIGNMNGWGEQPLLKFSHSGDVYENPVFSIVTEVPENCYWKIIAQTNVDGGEVWANGGVLGTVKDGDDAAEGTLVTVEPQAGKFPQAGWVKMTLNMMEYTYTVESLGEVSPYLYVPGDHQNWAPATAPKLYSSDFTIYKGFVSLNKEFKVTSKPSWEGKNYGDNGNFGLDAAGGNLTVSEAGLYLLTANLGSMTWSAALINTFGLIGDATEGGWDASTPMTYDAATMTYSVITTLKGTGAFKFRANDAWDINLGGTLESLTLDNGDNIATPGEGTYKIVLYLDNPEAFKFTIEKQ